MVRENVKRLRMTARNTFFQRGLASVKCECTSEDSRKQTWLRLQRSAAMPDAGTNRRSGIVRDPAGNKWA